VAAALHTEPIEPSHSPRRILRTLRNGEQIVAAVDVPADQVAASESIEFIGKRARVPRGLLRVAAGSRMPVTVYLTGIRPGDGKRTLQIHQVSASDDPRSLTIEVFAYLQRAIESDPAAWHFWSIAPRFLELGRHPPGG
jgi:lauroyl/myristoyl acyltransferase